MRTILTIMMLLMTADRAIPVNSSFIPSNDLEISVDSETGITEAEFKQVIKNFTAVYAPVVKQRGYTLTVKNKWTDSTLNSSTTVDGNKWVINAYGGLARAEKMTVDGYMLVMCHEIGHHLGGYPRYPSPNSWASSEGQSDYFATLKCFREVSMAGALLARPYEKIPETVEDRCMIHSSHMEREVCARSMMAGLSLAGVLNDLQRNDKPVSFDTPDSSTVSNTYYAHPKAQCRLDTYVAGATCDAKISEELSDSEPKKGACSQEAGNKQGYRPRCWYAPKSIPDILRIILS